MSLRITAVYQLPRSPSGRDSLLLVLLAKMRSGTYADFREGPPTLANIVGVGD